MVFRSRFLGCRDNFTTWGCIVIFWNVYLKGELLDTVPYSSDCDAEYVTRSLIEHDGYDPSIMIADSRQEVLSASPLWPIKLLTIETGDHAIRISAIGPNRYQVIYGADYREGARAEVSAHIGQSVFHALECLGRLDQ
jgi:hypothetical protein